MVDGGRRCEGERLRARARAGRGDGRGSDRARGRSPLGGRHRVASGGARIRLGRRDRARRARHEPPCRRPGRRPPHLLARRDGRGGRHARARRDRHAPLAARRLMHVVVDWDGTVTERDTLQMVLERFGDLDLYARAETALGRSMTLNQVIAAEMATVRAPLEEVVDWLRAQVVVRRGFRDLVDRHRPLVLSAGFHELIEPILEREGIAVEVVANRLVADAGGWRTVFRSAVPCAVCGEPCKRD
ncbi:MAG: hypothetical protein FJW96_04725, partial [Actinobacteria bacterium]|nr:hypothetical protein [Actinomycetota bacterium]